MKDVEQVEAVAPTQDRVLKCTVRDGHFVEPCTTLDENTDNQQAAFGRAKGITAWRYTSMTTLKPSRTFYGAKTKRNPNGHLFNFCPFCGEDISKPFMNDEDEQ